MSVTGRIRQFFETWVAALAATLMALTERSDRRQGRLVGTLTAEGWQLTDDVGRVLGDVSGATIGDLPWLRRRDIRAVLPETRLFRSSLPAVPEESRDFLPAIVELRVDRIAPWTRDDRLTGFRAAIADGQIAVDVAVTAKIFVQPLIDAAIRNEARSLTIAGSGGDDIQIAVPLPAATAKQAAMRRIAAYGLASFAAAIILAGAALAWQSHDVEQRRQLVQEQITARMAVIRKATAAAEGIGAAELDPLDARKQSGPLAVITLEALSRLLPDDTYLVSLRYDGETVRVAGYTRSFEQLVPMLVTSPYFSDARFSEPTERQADGSDRFAIELVLKPVANIEAL